MTREIETEKELIEIIRTNKAALNNTHIKELPFTTFDHDKDIVDFIKEKINTSDLSFFNPKKYPCSKTRMAATLYIASDSFESLPSRFEAPSAWRDTMLVKGAYLTSFNKKLTAKDIDTIGFDKLVRLNDTFIVNEPNHQVLANYAFDHKLIDKNSINIPFYNALKNKPIEELINQGYGEFMLNNATCQATQDINFIQGYVRVESIETVLNKLSKNRDGNQGLNTEFIDAITDLTIEKMRDLSTHEQTCLLIQLVVNHKEIINFEKIASDVDPLVLEEAKPHIKDRLPEIYQVELERSYLDNKIKYF